MRTLAWAAVVVVAGVLAAPAQTISGGTGQATVPQAERGGQRPGAPTTPPRDARSQPQAGKGRLRGRVVTADSGAPVRRAQVLLSAQGQSRTTTTDGEGRYEFTGLAAGSYNLNVTRPGFITQQYGQRRANAPGVPVVLANGQTLSQVDFALVRGGVITGRITDDFGDPMAGAQIQVQRYTYGPFGRQLTGAPTAPGNFMTDDLGQFRLYGLAPGDYVVSARVQTNMIQVPGQDDRREGFPPTYYPGTPNIAEAQTVSVSGAQETPVHFTMVASRLARVSGRVLDSQGRPAAGAMLQLSTGNSSGGVTFGAGQVSPDGTFTIANVPPGDHVIRVSPRPQVMGRDGLAPPGATAGDEPEAGMAPVTVTGEDLSGLLIQLRRTATLTGRIVFEGAAARPNLEQVRVSVTGADPQLGGLPVAQFLNTAGSSPARQNGQPAADGAFELRGVTGRVLLRVISAGAGGWQLQRVMLRGVDVTDSPIDVTDDVDGLRIVMTDRLTDVSGTVADAASAAPDGFAVIVLPREEIEGVAGQRYVRTVRLSRPDRFSVRGLPAGDYVAAAFEWLDNGREWDPRIREAVRASGERFSLGDGQQLTLSLRLTPLP